MFKSNLHAGPRTRKWNAIEPDLVGTLLWISTFGHGSEALREGISKNTVNVDLIYADGCVDPK